MKYSDLSNLRQTAECTESKSIESNDVYRILVNLTNSACYVQDLKIRFGSIKLKFDVNSIKSLYYNFDFESNLWYTKKVFGLLTIFDEIINHIFGINSSR